MKIDNLLGWQAFVGVAELGSFAQTSRTLKIPVPILSKRVAKLEDQLGVRLFRRSTRVVALTDDGAALLPKVKTLLDDFSELESMYTEKKELSGSIKITCVPFIAQSLLIPVIRDFQKVHPKVKIDLQLTETILNFAEHNIDLAFRIQTPVGGDLIYRKLAPNNLVLCASPAYLKKNKHALKKPADLASHDLLFLRLHEQCKFASTDLALKKFAHRKSLESDSGAFLTDLALQGFGVLVRSIWDVEKHLKSGQLVQVLKDHPLEPFGHLHVVIPNKKFMNPRARAFYEFVLERI